MCRGLCAVEGASSGPSRLPRGTSQGRQIGPLEDAGNKAIRTTMAYLGILEGVTCKI